MTLQEAKDQVVKKHKFDNWNDYLNAVRGNILSNVHADSIISEAAELYASSKWDEASEKQRAILESEWLSGKHTYCSQLLSVEHAPKPEFNP